MASFIGTRKGPLVTAFLSALVFACWAPRPALAAVGDAGFSLDPASLVSPDIVQGIVGLIAFTQQHRPYEPATPLGLAPGLDVSLEATLVKIPDSFFETLANNGFGQDAPIPSVPTAKLHLHKGFGPFFDAGASALFVLGNKILGADAKLVVLQGEEIPTLALRFCYSYTDLAISRIAVRTQTFAYQALVSRKMSFADPYLGVGVGYAVGDVTGEVPVPRPDGVPEEVQFPTSATIQLSSAALGAMAFGGVSLRMPISGFRLTIEGAYDYSGTSSLGTKIGFTF